MKKCSKLPDYKILIFEENPQRHNIYDLKTPENFTKFKYFRLEKPIKEYLIAQGVKFVCESWANNTKTLHTGLIPLGIDNYYFGDCYEIKNNRKIHSLIIFYFDSDSCKITLFYFNHFNKFSIQLNKQFCFEFIKKREVTTPPVYVQNQNLNYIRFDKANVINSL